MNKNISLLLLFLFLVSCDNEKPDNHASVVVTNSLQDEQVTITGKVILPGNINDILPDFDEDLDILPDFDEDLGEGSNFTADDFFPEKLKFLTTYSPSLVNKNVFLFIYDDQGKISKVIKNSTLDESGSFSFLIAKTLYDSTLLGIGLGNKNNLLLESLLFKTTLNQVEITSDISSRIIRTMILPYKKESFGLFTSQNRNKILEANNFLVAQSSAEIANINGNNLQGFKEGLIKKLFMDNAKPELFNYIEANTSLNAYQIRYIASQGVILTEKIIPQRELPMEAANQNECKEIDSCTWDSANSDLKVEFRSLPGENSPKIVSAMVNEKFALWIHSPSAGLTYVEIYINNPSDAGEGSLKSINDKNNNFPWDAASPDKGWLFPFELSFKTPGVKCIAFASGVNDAATLNYHFFRKLYVKAASSDKIPECLTEIPARFSIKGVPAPK